jgi:hypothetical protein
VTQPAVSAEADGANATTPHVVMAAVASTATDFVSWRMMRSPGGEGRGSPWFVTLR